MIPSIPVGNSLRLFREKTAKPDKYKGTIRKINYANRHALVLVNGYGLLRRVRISTGVNIGTADRKSVNIGDTCTVIQADDGWRMIAVDRKDHCATRTGEFEGEVIIEEDFVEPVSGDSWVTQQLGSLGLPDDLNIPPFELLGQLSLAGVRFPDPETFLCGIPECTDCAPTGYVMGYVVKLSSDAEHPSGCWVWGPRSSVAGQIYYRATVTLKTPTGADQLIKPGVSVTVKGNYAYVIDIPYEDSLTNLPIGNSFLYTIDMSSIGSPALVDTQDVGYPFDFSCIGYHNNTLYITGRADTEGSFHLLTYDISSPGSPSQTNDTSTDLGNLWTVYDSGGNPYLVGDEFGASFMVLDGTSLTNIGSLSVGVPNYSSPIVTDGLVIFATGPFPGSPEVHGIDITTPSSPSLLWSDPLSFSNGFITADLAYISDEYLYDVTTPASPVVTPITPGTVSGYHVAVVDIYMYSTEPNGSAKSVNILDPYNPELINIAGGVIPVGNGSLVGQTVQDSWWSNTADLLRFGFAGTSGSVSGDPDAGTYLVIYSNEPP